MHGILAVKPKGKQCKLVHGGKTNAAYVRESLAHTTIILHWSY
jgi:hypothetical protein